MTTRRSFLAAVGRAGGAVGGWLVTGLRTLGMEARADDPNLDVLDELAVETAFSTQRSLRRQVPCKWATSHFPDFFTTARMCHRSCESDSAT